MSPARPLTLICTALLLLAPAAAQTGGDDQADCRPSMSDRCPDEPDSPDSGDESSGNETTPDEANSDPSDDEPDAPDPDEKSPGNDEAHDKSDDADPDECRPASDCEDEPVLGDDRDHVTFDHVEGHIAMRDYRVDGIKLLDGAIYEGPDHRVQARSHGAYHVVQVGDDRIAIHDSPTGLLGFKGGPDGNGTFTLDFPDDATFSRGDRSILVTLGDRQAILVADQGTWEEDRLTVSGFATYHLRPAGQERPASSERPDPAADAPEERPDLDDAIRDRRVAATVDVKQTQQNGVTVEAYDDVNVTVMGADAPATRDAPLRIEVSGEFDEGRTFVANIDHDLLTGPELEMRAFIVHEDGIETEVRLTMADDITDILDPTNDSGNMEYWVVRDANGVQVLFSVGHFSTHAFTVASFGEVIAQPSVWVGAVAGTAIAAVAVGGMVWPRRR